MRSPPTFSRCAWLGELDSQEESDEISNEFDFKNEVTVLPLLPGGGGGAAGGGVGGAGGGGEH